MELICPSCLSKFEFKWWPTHIKRAKNHYCSLSCIKKTHWMSTRWSIDKRYKIWCNVKKRAKQQSTDFTLNIEDIPHIPEICPILWIKIISSNTPWPIDTSPSLDRINNNLWYIPWNVRIISNRANRIKCDATLDEIRLILKDAEFLSNKKQNDNT